ncbi:MAG: MTAP family purine nucleoside phosphorylase [Acidimicrobiia bacterium]|nr:MTAP family purine nucleoside phosphorylase [Acidimicrobiia bacterium]
MGRLAVAGGHGILGTKFAAGATRLDVDTPHGSVAVLDAGPYVVLQRHGLDHFTSAPDINHRAHLRALADLGCDRVLGLASVGSLHREVGVGAFVAPDDFIALHLGISFSDDATGHQSPGFDRKWRAAVVDRWSENSEVPLRDGGVYWQTIGPRFETQAEIRLLATHADLVGMTIASECILAGEVGIAYAAVCVVDNLANGVSDSRLTLEEFYAGAAANRTRLVDALDAVLPELVKDDSTT